MNVTYTIAGDDFATWVKDNIEERNSKVTKQKDLMINMDADVAAAFQASTHVSCKFLIVRNLDLSLSM